MRLAAIFLFALSLSATTLKTTITDKLSLALQGQPAVGSMTISWPSFMETDGTQVLGSSMTVRLTQGAFSVSLYPTDVATPTDGSTPPVRYTVRYVLTTGGTVTEYWSVPTTPSVLTIASVIMVGPPFELQEPNGAVLPATCKTSDLFFLTTTSQINVCTAPNSWAALTSATSAMFIKQLPQGQSGIPFVQSGNTRLATGSDLNSILGYTPTNPANNLSEYASNPSLARTNLGLGSAATMNSNQFMPANGSGFVSLVGGLVPANELPGLNALGGSLNLPQLNTTGTLTPHVVLHGDASWGAVDYAADVTNKPTIPTDLGQLSNNPGFVQSTSLARVATTGAFSDLSGAPTFGTIASHSASDYLSSTLLNANNGIAPLDGGGHVPLANLPTIPSTQISGIGTAASVALSTLLQSSTLGQANGPAQLDTNGKLLVAELPMIAYSSISNAPVVPTALSALTNDAGYVKFSNLATVATSNSYADLSNKPSLNFDAAGAAAAVLASSLQKTSNLGDLTNPQTARTNLGLATVASTGSYASLTGTPTLAAVATTGAYSSLSGTPTIPTTTSQLTNNSGFITSAGLSVVAVSGSYADLLNKPALNYDAAGAASAVLATSLQKSANLGDLASPSTARTNLGLAAVAASGAYTDISGTPVLAAVALSGSFSDLSNKPGIPTKVSQLTNDSGFLTTAGVSTAGISGSYTDLTNKPVIPTLATATVPGTVKPGSNLTVDVSGALSVNAAAFDAAGAATAATAGLLRASNNLSDIISPSTARTNLGLAVVSSTGSYADLANLPTLGTVASHPASDFLATTILGAHNGAAQLDSSGILLLAELPTAIPSTSITGLGTASTHPATDFVASTLLGANSGVATLTSAGKLTAAQVPTIAYSSLSGAPVLATVSTSGSYTDLLNLPVLPTVASGSAVGLVKPGLDLTVDGTGTLNVTASAFDPSGSATAAVVGLLKASNNLSDLASAATARTNLGLGSLATASASTLVADTGAAGIVVRGSSAGTSRVAINTDITGLLGYTPLNSAALGAASGAAQLDSGGLLLAAELPAAIPYASITGVPAFVAPSAIGTTIAPLSSGKVPAAYLPSAAIATTSMLGQVIASTGLLIDGSGNLSVNASLFDAAGAASSAVNGLLRASNNLSDLGSTSAARTNLGLAPVASTGSYSSLTGTPTLAAVATTGAYSSLSGVPTIPTTTSQLTNNSGFITSATVATTSTVGLVSASTGLSVNGGGALSVNYGSTTGTAAAGNDPRIVSALQPSSLGVASGIATLDGTGKLTSAQMPSINANSISGLGTAATQNSSYFVQASQVAAVNGVASLDNTIHVPIAQIPQIPYSYITNVPATYTLPIASGSTLGGVEVGSGLTINNTNGSLSVQFGTAPNQALNASLLAVPSGIATLDSSGHIPTSQIVAGGASGIALLDSNGKITLSEVPSGINANLIGTGAVNNSAFGYLSNVTSDIQAQLNLLATTGGAVASVFGRTGTITAQSADYATFYEPLLTGVTTDTNGNMTVQGTLSSGLNSSSGSLDLAGLNTGNKVTITVSDNTAAGTIVAPGLSGTMAVMVGTINNGDCVSVSGGALVDGGSGCGGYSNVSNGYSYLRAITLGNITGTLTNFPFLISGTYAYLANTSSGGLVTNSNGYDIIFTSDSAGNNLLSWDLEKYVSSTGQIVAWVNVPSATTGTTIYMFYGKPSVSVFQGGTAGAAWDAVFGMVQHFPNGSTLSTTDSTINANNATNVGATAAGGTGITDGVASFTASSSQYMALTEKSSIEPAGPYTISAWVKRNDTGQSGDEFFFSNWYQGDGNYHGILFNFGGTSSAHGDQIRFFHGNGSTTYTPAYSAAITDLNWHYVVGTWNGSTLQIYVDGAASGTTASYTGTPNYTSAVARIGDVNTGSEGSYYYGGIDELRIANTARSSAWIAAEYANQSSPSTFYSIGSQSTISGGGGGSSFNGGTISNPLTISGVSGGGLTLSGSSSTDVTTIFTNTNNGWTGAVYDNFVTANENFAAGVGGSASSHSPNQYFIYDVTSGYPVFHISPGGLTEILRGKFRVDPINTDPGCTTANDIGKIWYDNTTTTTSVKNCLSNGGTINWAAVGGSTFSNLTVTGSGQSDVTVGISNTAQPNFAGAVYDSLTTATQNFAAGLGGNTSSHSPNQYFIYDVTSGYPVFHISPGGLTEIVQGKFRVNPTGTNPGCSGTGDIGKIWMNNSANPTLFEVCLANSSGVVGWVSK